MPNKPFKVFERECAKLFGGSRFWSNSGESLDFESPYAVGQAKLRKNLSLERLTQLAEEIWLKAESKGKLGVVCAKVRRGSGRASPTLVIMTAKMFDDYFSFAKRHE